MSPNLLALEKKIGRVLARQPECFITHPAELAVLHPLSSQDLQSFASNNGWRTVVRVGGRQIEFYRDAMARSPEEEE